MTTDDALQQVFDWFDANGGTDSRPYAVASVPGVNVTIREPLTSPYAIEYAGGISRSSAAAAALRVDGVCRDIQEFLQPARPTSPRGR